MCVSPLLFRTCSLDIFRPRQAHGIDPGAQAPPRADLPSASFTFQMKRPFYPHPNSPLATSKTRPPCQTFKLKSQAPSIVELAKVSLTGMYGFQDRGQWALCETSSAHTPILWLHRDQLVEWGNLDVGVVQRQLCYPGLVVVVDFRLETCRHDGAVLRVSIGPGRADG